MLTHLGHAMMFYIPKRINQQKFQTVGGDGMKVHSVLKLIITTSSNDMMGAICAAEFGLQKMKTPSQVQ